MTNHIITIRRIASNEEFAKHGSEFILERLAFTEAETVRRLRGPLEGPQRFVRNLTLDQAADLLREWDEDCNEGRADLWEINDAAVRSLI